MDEEKKGFNLNVLISMLVGVISLIVIIPTVTMIMNKNRPEEVTPEEYRLVFDKYQDYQIRFQGFDLGNTAALTQDFSSYDNLISITLTADDTVITVSYPDEEDLHYLEYIAIFGDTYNSDDYMLTYLDPVSNDKLYGTYDFSNISITEASQVLNPIYTPFTTPYF